MDNLIFILNVVSPVFFLVFLGIILKKVNLINKTFVTITSEFVFKVSLPVLVFLKLYDTEISKTFDLAMTLYVLIATVILFLGSWALGVIFTNKPEDKGVFIQGAFRSNYAIVGLSIILNMFGDEAVAKASLILVFVIPLYNVLSIIALVAPFKNEEKISLMDTVKSVALNPLILGLVAAVPFSIFQWELIPAIKTTGEYISGIALPLALLSIGGSINIAAVKKAKKLAFIASVVKIIIAPFFAVAGAYLLGFKGDDFGIIFIIFGCPTAIASFIMAIAMRGNGKLAGNIVVLSTIGSVITFTIGLYLLKVIGMI